MTPDEALAALQEVSLEIARLNKAAGHTVFNPAATQGLREVIFQMELEAAQ